MFICWRRAPEAFDGSNQRLIRKCAEAAVGVARGMGLPHVDLLNGFRCGAVTEGDLGMSAVGTLRHGLAHWWTFGVL